MKTTLFNKSSLIICMALAVITFSYSYGQTFNATGAMPLDLAGGTQNISSCSSNRSITFTVSGVGVLSASNQLLEIDLRLQTDRRLYGDAYLRAPDGTCVHIASQFGDPGSYNARNLLLDYKFRAPQPCLNKYPDYFPQSSHTYAGDANSRSGVFSTVDDISTAFSGVNADGTWTMYFGRGSSSEPPIVISSGLTFGEPIPVAPADPSAGLNCVNAIVWDGSPLCATTAGHVNTQPNAPAANFSGCQWMSTSENNVWIAFTPTSADVCLNISGVNAVSGSATGVQSIVVSPTNPGTPCDNSWTLENCPRNDIYSSNVGTVTGSNHCFTAVPGQTYYIIVDGNAGAVTELYITGTEGLPVILAAELISFDYECTDNGLEFNWVTATESHNDYFAIDYSEDGQNWIEIGREQGMGFSERTTLYSHNLTSRKFKGYYKLKQIDFDGKVHNLRTIAVNNCDNEKELKVVPNPSSGIIYLMDVRAHNLNTVSVVDLLGNEIYNTEVQKNQKVLTIDLSVFPKGVYFVISKSNTDEVSTNRVLIK